MDKQIQNVSGKHISQISWISWRNFSGSPELAKLTEGLSHQLLVVIFQPLSPWLPYLFTSVAEWEVHPSQNL